MHALKGGQVTTVGKKKDKKRTRTRHTPLGKEEGLTRKVSSGWCLGESVDQRREAGRKFLWDWFLILSRGRGARVDESSIRSPHRKGKGGSRAEEASSASLRRLPSIERREKGSMPKFWMYQRISSSFQVCGHKSPP